MESHEELKKEYEDLSKKLSDPELSLNREKYGKTSKRFSYLQNIIGKTERKELIEKNIKENEEILKNETDEEMKTLAREDLEKIKKEKNQIEKTIDAIKKESDPSTSHNEILVEIRAGAGGDEASLFAKNLFEMYQKFCQKMNWNLIILDSSQTDLNGIKSISFEISGKSCGNYFKYESGVHRVQRIPETEKMGRIHTSTASVAILPKAKQKDIEIKPNEIKMETCKSSAPGGQNVNKRETAARITHIPTGMIVSSQTTRTLAQNRENAMALLRSKLLAKKN